MTAITELSLEEQSKCAIKAMKKAAKGLDQGLPIPRFQPLLKAIFSGMTVVSFEKLEDKQETYLCTLLDAYLMPTTYKAGKKIHELIVPRQFPMIFSARSRLIWFKEKNGFSPIENERKGLLGELCKNTYSWIAIGIDRERDCYSMTAIHRFGLFKAFGKGAFAIRLTKYEEAIAIWKNRKKLSFLLVDTFFLCIFLLIIRKGLLYAMIL